MHVLRLGCGSVKGMLNPITLLYIAIEHALWYTHYSSPSMNVHQQPLKWCVYCKVA